MTQAPHRTELPLCVDLDGTYLKCDSTWDMLAMFLLSGPVAVVYALAWSVRGRAYLKTRLVDAIKPIATNFPRDEALQRWMKANSENRRCILVSGAPQSLVDCIVAEDESFAEGIGSTAYCNLVAERKATLLAERFGYQGFDYVGNSHQDIPVWRLARRACCVRPSTSLRRKLMRLGLPVEEIGPQSSINFQVIAQLVRTPHIVKNFLCFIALIAGHQWHTVQAWQQCVVAFGVLVLGSSFVYIANDLRDLDADRQHPRKRLRPMASGALSSKSGIVLLLIFGLMWMGSLALLNPTARGVAIIQVVASIIYTIAIKLFPVLDVVWLGMLYANRTVVGSFAIEVTPTPWLIGSTVFFFTGIAALKRFAELRSSAASGEIAGRGYLRNDQEMIRLFGYGSAVASVLILALYITQPEVASHYPRPAALWALCILQFYWSTRTWLSASRGIPMDDPVAYVLRDRMSHWTLALAIVVFVAAVY